MGARSKSGNARGAAHKAAVGAARGRRRKNASAAWEQVAQIPEERIGEIDCQRIVPGDGERHAPRDPDDYN